MYKKEKNAKKDLTAAVKKTMMGNIEGNVLIFLKENGTRSISGQKKKLAHIRIRV